MIMIGEEFFKKLGNPKTLQEVTLSILKSPEDEMKELYEFALQAYGDRLNKNLDKHIELICKYPDKKSEIIELLEVNDSILLKNDNYVNINDIDRLGIIKKILEKHPEINYFNENVSWILNNYFVDENNFKDFFESIYDSYAEHVIYDIENIDDFFMNFDRKEDKQISLKSKSKQMCECQFFNFEDWKFIFYSLSLFIENKMYFSIFYNKCLEKRLGRLYIFFSRIYLTEERYGRDRNYNLNLDYKDFEQIYRETLKYLEYIDDDKSSDFILFDNNIDSNKGEKFSLYCKLIENILEKIEKLLGVNSAIKEKEECLIDFKVIMANYIGDNDITEKELDGIIQTIKNAIKNMEEDNENDINKIKSLKELIDDICMTNPKYFNCDLVVSYFSKFDRQYFKFRSGRHINDFEILARINPECGYYDQLCYHFATDFHDSDDSLMEDYFIKYYLKQYDLLDKPFYELEETQLKNRQRTIGSK